MTDINFIKKISSLNGSIQPGHAVNKENGAQAFKDIFNEKCKSHETAENEVVFSRHANERVRERNIDVSQSVTDRLTEAVEQARGKGLKNVLVMIDNQAFIVSTEGNKVITALKGGDLKENIFTNIDGAVIK